MLTTIIKRDGSEELFDFEKVVNAVSAAFKDVGEPVPEDIRERLAFVSESPDRSTVEHVQDQLEFYLITHFYSVGKSFMLYRHERKLIRTGSNKLVKQIAAKLRAENVENQNANVDEFSFGGRVGEASDVVTKNFALNNLISKKSKRNHENNRIYIHDLSAYADGRHNCMSEPLDDMLKNGFILRQTDIRPAKSVSTALQLVAVLFQVQSLEQFGGVSGTHLDWTLVPYLRMTFTKFLKYGVKRFYDSDYSALNEFFERKRLADLTGLSAYELTYLWNPDAVTFDDVELRDAYPEAWSFAMEMTREELNQSVEGLYHNLNSLQSRSGAQLNQWRAADYRNII